MCADARHHTLRGYTRLATTSARHTDKCQTLALVRFLAPTSLAPCVQMPDTGAGLKSLTPMSDTYGSDTLCRRLYGAFGNLYRKPYWCILFQEVNTDERQPPYA
jgi:hypothetical protein